jgi:hypothetical protein
MAAGSGVGPNRLVAYSAPSHFGLVLVTSGVQEPNAPRNPPLTVSSPPPVAPRAYAPARTAETPRRPNPPSPQNAAPPVREHAPAPSPYPKSLGSKLYVEALFPNGEHCGLSLVPASG